jgi:hypothetical protein
MPRTVQFNGSVHQFPDNATDDEVRSALEEYSAKWGYNAPGIPAAPIAAGLGTPTDAPGSFGLGARNPRTGQPYSEKTVAARVPLLDAPTEGIKQMVGGVEAMADPSMNRKAHGASQIVRGAMGVAAPLLPVALAAAPVATGLTLAGGMLAGSGTENALKAVGVPEGYAELGGDVAGLAAGYGANRGAGSLTAPQFRGRASAKLLESAKQNFYDALNPTTKVNKALTENKVAQGLVDRGVVSTSLKDLRERAQAQMEHYGEKIDDAFDARTDQNLRVSPDPILQELEAQKQGAMIGKVVPAASKAHVAKLAELQDEIRKVADANEGNIPVADLRKLRQINDTVVAQSKRGFALPPDELGKIDAHRIAGNAQRGALAEAMPEAADLNREFSFWKNVDKVAGDTSTRRVGQRTPLTDRMFQGTGAAIGASIAGPKGAFAGAELGGKLSRLKNSMIWNSVSARTKARVAALIDSGDTAGALQLADRAALDASAQSPRTYTTADGRIGATDAVLPPAGASFDAPPTATIPEPGAQPNEPGPVQSQSGPEAANAGTGREVAPLPRPDGAGAPQASGTATRVRVPGEAKSYAGRYEVRELADVRPSHNGHTFQPNPEYGLKNDRDYDNPANQGKVVSWSSPAEFDPSFHITDNPDATNGPIVIDSSGNALGGNGRGMILQRVYGNNPKGAAAYRELLANKAQQFGIDPETVRGMKQPVLTRVIDDAEFARPGSKQDAVTDFNKKGTAELTPGERAIADSRRVSPATLDDVSQRLEAKGGDATLAQVLEGKSGSEVLQKLIGDGVISPQERAAFMSEDGLTKAGKDRIASLMLGRFFRDPAQLDNIPASVRNKLERLAAPLARVEGYEGWSLTEQVKEAVDLLEEATTKGFTNVDDFVKQNGIFSRDQFSPKAVALARHLKSTPPNQLVNAVRQYAQDAQHASGGATMFGEPPTPGQSFVDALGAKR